MCFLPERRSTYHLPAGVQEAGVERCRTIPCALHGRTEHALVHHIGCRSWYTQTWCRPALFHSQVNANCTQCWSAPLDAAAAHSSLLALAATTATSCITSSRRRPSRFHSRTLPGAPQVPMLIPKCGSVLAGAVASSAAQ
eukprot:SAG31_NODE_7208_length_1755_cov_1.413647_2_plen_140_part_00